MCGSRRHREMRMWALIHSLDHVLSNLVNNASILRVRLLLALCNDDLIPS